MNANRNEILKEIEKNIYAHNLADLKVFSKQYFHSVILPCYKNNNSSPSYSMISIDFNDMQKINDKYGFKKGDQVIHDAVAIMSSVMPGNSYCVRTGGDEFIYILDNFSLQDTIAFEKKSHEQLHINSKNICNLSVTSHCMNSSSAVSLSDLIDISDSAINFKKSISKNNLNYNSLDNWSKLENKINQNLTRFFNTLRLHDFPLDETHLSILIDKIDNLYDSYIEDNIKPINDNKHSVNNTKISSDNKLKLYKLNKLLVRNRFGHVESNEFDGFDLTTLTQLLDSLVHDPITNYFNKSYLAQYLLEEKNKTFNALRISSTFVKLSNTLNDSHSTTNKQIEKQSNDVYNFLNKYIKLNEKLFSLDPSNYLISLGGGDMLLLLEENRLNVQDIQNFLNYENSNSYSNDNLLRLVCANKFRKINKFNFNKILEKQDKECYKNKEPLINEILSNEVIDDLLNITLNDTINFYKYITPDIKNNESKERFLNLIHENISKMHPEINISKNDNSSISIYQKIKSNIFEYINLHFRKNKLLPSENITKITENANKPENNFKSSLKTSINNTSDIRKSNNKSNVNTKDFDKDNIK